MQDHTKEIIFKLIVISVALREVGMDKQAKAVDEAVDELKRLSELETV